MNLNQLWFFLVGLMFGIYAVLDGFDLGLGAVSIFFSKDERKDLIKIIAPHWGGNEVWLISGGGALFAAFPEVYSTVFSGFYSAMVLLLVCLIFRAISLEFRNKIKNSFWESLWDIALSISSALAAAILGIALGNIITGIPLDKNYDYSGGFIGLFSPYALMTGLLSLMTVSMHGACFAARRAEGIARQHLGKIAQRSYWAYLVLFVSITVFTAFSYGRMLVFLHMHNIFYLMAFLLLAASAMLIIQIKKENFRASFRLSSLIIILMLSVAGLGIFPNIVFASNDSSLNLNIYNSASSQLTLKTMLIIACMGLPPVTIYTIYTYRLFRKKGGGSY